ncbi:MAG: signal peptide peptidase SppA [Rhodospirillaceae bacterium]|nr:signal peptide peptidase SppA [Rhodospirillaceae bacterium]
MAYGSDYLVDRRRLKRRLRFWQVVSVVAIVGTIVASFSRFGDTVLGGDFIARVFVKGIIVQDDQRLLALSDLAKNDAVKAVILRIDSPGGTIVGGETLYRAVLDLAKEKPVVAVMDAMAASAGYMAAIGADRLFAREGTLTGSIGVILQTTEVTKLLEMIGVSARSFKSGPLKSSPSPVERITPKVEAITQELIDEVYRMFRDMVLERRNMEPGEEFKFADGRIFTGRQALKNGLIDEIGGEKVAITWLEKEKEVPKDLRVLTVNQRRDVDNLIERLGSLARKTILSERLTLDGLISVWQPQSH